MSLISTALTVTKFDPSGVLIGSFGSGYTSNDPESILFDAAGEAFVGQADGSRQILKFSKTGTLLASFSAATEDRGTDWDTLSGDQCTMYYTSEGHHVKRYNVCTNTQLPDFNTVVLPGPNAYALRIRLNGDVLVADSSVVVRLNAAGAQVQTYSCSGSTGVLFALNLDPDTTSFWTGDAVSGAVCKIDIASGTVLKSWSIAPGFLTSGGLSVKGEILVAQAKLALTPDLATNPIGTTHTVTASLTAQPFCHGGTNSTSPPQACNVLSDCTDHTTAGTSFNESGYSVYFGVPGTCSNNASLTCLANADCGGGNTCVNSNFSPNLGATGVGTTNATGVATFTYSDTGGVGADTIGSCADTDIFTTGADDTGYVNCVNAVDNTTSNNVVKYWTNLSLTPLQAFDLVGGSHTVTATVTASPFCHGGTNPTSPPALCKTLADCPDHTTAGTSCDESRYTVFFAVPGTCSNNASLACVTNTDCGAGNTCVNSNNSPNFGTTASATTNAAGMVTFTFSYLGGAGKDTLSVCADTDLIVAPDETSYAPCVNTGEDTVSPNAFKYWLANFVTGGGKVVCPSGATWCSKGSFWTFGGNVGPNPAGPGIVGEWEEVYHPGKGPGVACHWDTFSFLNFSGPPTSSPPSTHNTAEFIGDTGICNNGSTPTVDVIEVDNAEPGKGADTLQVTGPFPLQILPAQKLSGGNIQVHDVP